MRPSLTALPRTVWVLGFISLLNDSASELIYPLIPLYLATVLAAGPRALGLIEGAAEAASALLKLASGLGYDRIGRAKPFVVAGYGLAAVARPLIALVAVWPALLALRVMDRIGKGLRSSPRDAWLAASVDLRHRGLAFGLHRALDNAGGVIGPLAAAALLAAQVPIRDILLWAALPGALCVALALSLREPAREVATDTVHAEWTWRGLSPAYQRLLATIAVFTLGNASNAFLLLRASELGLPPAQVALLWALVSGTATLLSVPLSGLSDRIGRVRLILAGWVLYAAVFVVLGLAGRPEWMWPIALAFGLYLALTEGAERALIADLVPPARRGTAFGWYYLVKGLLLLPASAVFGLLWFGLGPAVAFGAGAAWVLLAAALLLGWVGPALRGLRKSASR